MDACNGDSFSVDAIAHPLSARPFPIVAQDCVGSLDKMSCIQRTATAACGNLLFAADDTRLSPDFRSRRNLRECQWLSLYSWYLEPRENRSLEARCQSRARQGRILLLPDLARGSRIPHWYADISSSFTLCNAARHTSFTSTWRIFDLGVMI